MAFKEPYDLSYFQRDLDLWFTDYHNAEVIWLPDSLSLRLELEATATSKKDITKIGFLFNLDHLRTDGIGIRIIAGVSCDYLLKDYPQEVMWRMWTLSGKIVLASSLRLG